MFLLNLFFSSDNDYSKCINEIDTYNCSYKVIWKKQIEEKQNENNILSDFLRNNITSEKEEICSNFTLLRKKIKYEDQKYNNSLDILQANLFGIRKAAEILKNFYNLTSFSTLFLQFQDSIKNHDSIEMKRSSQEIKILFDDIKEKMILEHYDNENHIFQKNHKQSLKKRQRSLVYLNGRTDSDFEGKDLKIILKAYEKIKTLVDLMQNSTVLLTDYHNSIVEYYEMLLDNLGKLEERNEMKFNETSNKISSNTLFIKEHETKINNCIGKASEKIDCELIKTKLDELLKEVQEFIRIIDEIMGEFH